MRRSVARVVVLSDRCRAVCIGDTRAIEGRQ
jgi:hypothetical protein